MGSTTQFLYQKLVFLVGVFWFFVSTYFLPLFGLITSYLLRFKNNENCLKDDSANPELTAKDDHQEEKPKLEPEKETKEEIVDSAEEGITEFCEEESNQLCLQFKFPTYQEHNKSKREDDEPFTFLSGKSFSSFFEDSEVVYSTAQELNLDTKDGSFGDGTSVVHEEFLSNNDLDFKKASSEAQTVHDDSPEISNEGFLSYEDFNQLHSNEEKDSEETAEEQLEATAEEKGPPPPDAEKVGLADEDVNVQVTEIDNSDIYSDTESTSDSTHLRSVISSFLDSCSDEFLSDGEFGGEFNTLIESDHEMLEFNDEMLQRHKEDYESDDFDEEDGDLLEELRKLEENSTSASHSEFLSEKDFCQDLDKSENGEVSGKDENPIMVVDSDYSGARRSKSLKNMDLEDSNRLESLWEHQELTELKMELRKVRATGLPTILEESESPKIMEDLKPWKIDEKFHREDCMGELHKFYKSYRERMRKFDILNYQKMYAIGFLQLKDPLESISKQKSSFPAIKSLLPQNLGLGKRKIHGSNPMMKFIKEVQSDLEAVYVGQMCLSWEILHWQYEKALDLWESDPRGIHRYNKVAGEFQRFQVLLQRFIEDEPFQGPRIQIYVKNRCFLRNLLQVPLVREDSLKEKRNRISEKGEYAITSDMLVETIEESIRIFWRFLRTDKDCSIVSRTGQTGKRAVLQDAADTKLLMEVPKELQKKERKLKDLLRSGNCILRKFRKCREDNSDQVLYFFSQVDMKLVTRVLSMPKITTEQLIWCRNKLSKINFVNRKIQVEPSFLLFPC